MRQKTRDIFVERDRNRRKMAKKKTRKTDFRGKKEKWLQVGKNKEIHKGKNRKK